MKKTIRVLVALMCMLALLCAGYAMAEEAAETPTATPAPTPSAEELGKLTFEINGPDESMPRTVHYSDFQDGKYELKDLAPGTYTVSEIDPEKLLEEQGYTFDAENSVQTITIEVKPAAPETEETGAEPTEEPAEKPAEGAGEAEGEALLPNQLKNVYVRNEEETPTPPPETTEDTIEIPVTKRWDDNGNRDGNRPNRVIVHLLADGKKTAQAVLTAGNGWSYRFTELPKLNAAGQEIKYTITEEAIPMYIPDIDGYDITNVYSPVLTSATISKVWNDNNNAAGLRPKSIYCTLSNGTHVVLNEENGWTATVNNLPTVVNGKPVTYTWTEQEIIGYKQTGKETAGGTTVFTNTVIERDVPPPEGKTPPKKRGDKYVIIEDYVTPLGVEVVINHVGDCFD